MLILGLLGTLAFAGGDDVKSKVATSIRAKKRKARKKRRKKNNQRKEHPVFDTHPSANGNHMPTYPSGGYEQDVPVSNPEYHNPSKNRDTSTFRRPSRDSSSTTKKRNPNKTSTTYQERTTTHRTPNRDRRSSSGIERQESRTTSSGTRNREYTHPTTTTTKRRTRTSTTSRERDSSTTTTHRRRTRTRTYDTSSRSRDDYRNNPYSNNYTSSSSTRPSSRVDRCYFKTKFGVRGGQNALKSQTNAQPDGMGWAIGLAPCDGILEMEVSHISFGGDDYSFGMDSPLQVTAQLYGKSSGFAPFVSFGVHGAKNDLIEPTNFVSEAETEYGLHGGLGVRYKLAMFSVQLEGRYLTYENQDVSQIQGNAGINVYF